jgi:Uma2 family endonuclease
METARTEHEFDRTSADLAPDALKRLEAWLLLPEGDRAELIRGHIVYKTMASLEHGGAIIEIAGQLHRLQGPPGGGLGGWWLSQEVDMFLSGQGLRPDLVGWRVEKHPRPPQKVNVGTRHLGVYVTPPDWVCEVLSGSTRARDEDDGAKWQAYFDAGVGHYWLVDLVREQVLVHRRSTKGYEPIEVAGREATRTLPPFETVVFSAARMFELTRLMRLDPG